MKKMILSLLLTAVAHAGDSEAKPSMAVFMECRYFVNQGWDGYHFFSFVQRNSLTTEMYEKSYSWWGGDKAGTTQRFADYDDEHHTYNVISEERTDKKLTVNTEKQNGTPVRLEINLSTLVPFTYTGKMFIGEQGYVGYKVKNLYCQVPAYNQLCKVISLPGCPNI